MARSSRHVVEASRVKSAWSKLRVTDGIVAKAVSVTRKSNLIAFITQPPWDNTNLVRKQEMTND